jgi:hypothetical protein
VTHGKTLAGEASAWTTPQAHDAHGGSADRLGRYGTKAGGRNLADDVMVQRDWQTPATFQGKYRRQVNQTERTEELLPGQAKSATERAMQWGTPTSRDWKDGASPSMEAPTNGLLGRQAPRTAMPGDESLPADQTSRRRLNPRFVEWLMGWPDGYLALTSSTFSVTE